MSLNLIDYLSCRGSQHSQNLSQNQQIQSHSEGLGVNSNNYSQTHPKDPLHTIQDALQEALQDVDDANASTISPPPPPPTTEPPEEVTSFSWRTNNENQSSKTKTLLPRKPVADTANHLSNSSNSLSMLNNNIANNNGNNVISNNNSNNNSMHMVSLSRRIEMPPAFLFPENETPPADLIATRDENRVSC